MLKISDIDSLAACVTECTICPRMVHRFRVFGAENGNPKARVLFIAEAPGRLGADRTGIPLHGDKTGDNFEHLMNFIGWKRADVFITNAVLCNPRTEEGLNDKPTKEEVVNCSAFLAATIRLVDPIYIVTLGSSALEALRNINTHRYELASHVRKVLRWNGRFLIPLYHPGPRAVAQRNMLNMESDFRFLKEKIGNPVRPKLFNYERAATSARAKPPKNSALPSVVRLLVNLLEPVSLFRLHKILYLAEVESRALFSSPFLGIYYIRQKDGPFAPEVTQTVRFLLKQHLKVLKTNEGPCLVSRQPRQEPNLTMEQRLVLESVVAKYGKLQNRGIKMAAYRHGPMRELMEAQKQGKETYNQPLFTP